MKNVFCLGVKVYPYPIRAEMSVKARFNILNETIRTLSRVVFSQCFEEPEALLRDMVDASFRSFDVSVLEQPCDDGLGLPRRRGLLEDGLRQRRPPHGLVPELEQHAAGDPELLVQALRHLAQAPGYRLSSSMCLYSEAETDTDA